jgi:hypothetical protein
MDKASRYLDAIIRQVGQFEMIHWIGVAVVLLVVGIGCMRTMNSRM